MISAPMSERFGRRPVYHVGVFVFALFILGAGLSQSLPALIVCRFFAGAFGGSVLVVGFGILVDIWNPAELPIALSIFNTVPFCGPAVSTHTLKRDAEEMFKIWGADFCFKTNDKCIRYRQPPLAMVTVDNTFLSRSYLFVHFRRAGDSHKDAPSTPKKACSYNTKHYC